MRLTPALPGNPENHAHAPSLEQVVRLGNLHLGAYVAVDIYDYASCYLWYDRPLYNEFGEAILQLRGDSIYLYRDADTPVRDLFHELGHVVGRACELVGNAENGYHGSWEKNNGKLIAEVSEQRHWSHYLNLYALSHSNFRENAASELWAELFMLWFLHPDGDEAGLVDAQLQALQDQPLCAAIWQLAQALDTARSRAGPVQE